MAAPRPRFDASINYYQVLNVPYGASREEITRSYRNLMRLTHPDHFQEPLARAKAEERAKLINAAYTVLSRSETRSEYDRQMRATVMSDALMQRYTGSAPGRPSPLPHTPRPPAPHVIRARKRAYNSAIRQLLLITTIFVAGVVAFALALALLNNLGALV